MKTYYITDFGAVAGSKRLQNKAIQAALDACKEEGGKVVIPKGVFRISSVRMWSDTILYLEAGACLVGSDNSEDYEVYDVPDGVELHTDMQLIPQYYQNKMWNTYYRAMISVYGGKNIAIIGEPGSHIDGNDCTDPLGEEGYRGPHGMMLTNIDNLTLMGYEIANCGNFMHQIDTCTNITIRNITCLGGSDGVHLHHCAHILIEDCVFHTGDDCIAGINMTDLLVRNCDINTSCDAFRAGGVGIHVENCHIWGPGIYPHRVTVVQNLGTELVRDKANTLPQSAGRHNLICTFLHFASMDYPNPTPFADVVFKDCIIENADRFLVYHADLAPLEAGTHLTEIQLENVTFQGLLYPSDVRASAEEPLTVTMQNVRASFREGAHGNALFDGQDCHTTLIEA